MASRRRPPGRAAPNPRRPFNVRAAAQGGRIRPRGRAVEDRPRHSEGTSREWDPARPIYDRSRGSPARAAEEGRRHSGGGAGTGEHGGRTRTPLSGGPPGPADDRSGRESADYCEGVGGQFGWVLRGCGWVLRCNLGGQWRGRRDRGADFRKKYAPNEAPFIIYTK